MVYESVSLRAWLFCKTVHGDVGTMISLLTLWMIFSENIPLHYIHTEGGEEQPVPLLLTVQLTPLTCSYIFYTTTLYSVKKHPG